MSLFRMILLAGIVAGCAGDSDAGKDCSPNILIIFADDMGYGDVSCLNPESGINTASIDELAGLEKDSGSGEDRSTWIHKPLSGIP